MSITAVKTHENLKGTPQDRQGNPRPYMKPFMPLWRFELFTRKTLCLLGSFAIFYFLRSTTEKSYGSSRNQGRFPYRCKCSSNRTPPPKKQQPITVCIMFCIWLRRQFQIIQTVLLYSATLICIYFSCKALWEATMGHLIPSPLSPSTMSSHWFCSHVCHSWPKKKQKTLMSKKKRVVY